MAVSPDFPPEIKNSGIKMRPVGRQDTDVYPFFTDLINILQKLLPCAPIFLNF